MVASLAVSELLAGWTHLYGHSTAARAAVTYVHLIGILVGGGLAVATDRASLQLSPATVPDWQRELARLAAVHRWVVAGLGLIFASGLLMMLAELNTFATSAVFWTKMGLVALLLGNGYVRCARRRRSETGSRAVGVDSGGRRSRVSRCGFSSS
jgi:hypothetical protein